MKLSDGFKNIIPSMVYFIAFAVSFTLLPVVLTKIDLSITYAVWSGVGTLVTCTTGAVCFKEKVTFIKICAIALILAGVTILNAVSGEGEWEGEGGGEGEEGGRRRGGELGGGGNASGGALPGEEWGEVGEGEGEGEGRAMQMIQVGKAVTLV
jgi:small multidrug resistance pump